MCSENENWGVVHGNAMRDFVSVRGNVFEGCCDDVRSKSFHRYYARLGQDATGVMRCCARTEMLFFPLGVDDFDGQVDALHGFFSQMLHCPLHLALNFIFMCMQFLQSG